MANLEGRIVLVTGASAGIGLAVAETLAKHGMKVIGCARNIDKIHDLNKLLTKDQQIHAVKTDLTKEQEVLALFKDIETKYSSLDILINNAGMGTDATLLDGEFAKWKQLTDLNVLALTLSSREAVRLMESGKSTNGHIININSIVGHFVPSKASSQFYSGTKHMVTALTEGLRKAAQPKNIRVTSLSPGIVETEFAERAYKDAPDMIQHVRQLLQQFKALEAQDIADAVVYVLSAPQHVNIDELTITPLHQKPIT